MDLKLTKRVFVVHFKHNIIDKAKLPGIFRKKLTSVTSQNKIEIKKKQVKTEEIKKRINYNDKKSATVKILKLK